MVLGLIGGPDALAALDRAKQDADTDVGARRRARDRPGADGGVGVQLG